MSLVSDGEFLVRGCPKCPLLCDGHFGHLKFKIFLNFDFDGHLVDRHDRLIDGEFFGTLYTASLGVFINL